MDVAPGDKLRMVRAPPRQARTISRMAFPDVGWKRGQPVWLSNQCVTERIKPASGATAGLCG